MNRERRDRLGDAIAMLNDANKIVMSVCNEEQYSLDNIPDNLQGTERYSNMEKGVESLEDSCECIYESIRYINDAIA